jgi:hypothetical protein
MCYDRTGAGPDPPQSGKYHPPPLWKGISADIIQREKNMKNGDDEKGKTCKKKEERKK